MRHFNAIAILFLLLFTSSIAQVRLPDTEITTYGKTNAWLIDPTTRYEHGVLGDKIEAGGFMVDNKIFRLNEDAVFEDRRVRLHMLNGRLVAVIIKSYLKKGASIALYSIGETIMPLAETAPIGQPNRWLNIVGIADFTGSGEMMIAAVITPHLRGSLRLYNIKLQEIVRIDGYTNHIIGDRNLDLGRINKANEIVLPSLDRRSLATISFKNGEAKLIKNISVKASIRQILPINDNNITVVYDTGEREVIK